MKEKLQVLTIVLLMANVCFGQVIYVQKNRYSEKIVSNKSIKNYYFIGSYYIDRGHKNTINYEDLKKGLDKIVPDVSSTEMICLDIENAIYQGLKTKGVNDKNFISNSNALVELIRFVKKNRPFAKVGIYGIPYSFNYDFQKKYNDKEKLRSVINEVDFLSPAIYLYHGKEKSTVFFSNYLEENLNLFLDYSITFNKPLIPYIWYRVHPSNKKIGSTVITDDVYANYIKKIDSYRFKSKGVDGVIYWEPAKASIDINEKLTQTLSLFKSK